MPIFDQGYQHWNGQLSGHQWRWLAVTRQGVRAILSNIFVRLLLLLAWLPALVLAAFLAIWGMMEQGIESVLSILSGILPPDIVSEPEIFRKSMWTIAYSFYFKAELFVVFFLVLLVGPNLISRDLRFNALPLYLSRPVRRIDYFLGKLGVIAFFIGAVVIAPTFVAYVLGVAFSLDVNIIQDTYHLLFASLGFALIVVLSVGTLMLALSSLSRRTIYVALMWVGFWLISTTVSYVLSGVQTFTVLLHANQVEMKKFVEKNPPPPGVRLSNNNRITMRRIEKGESQEQKQARRLWMRQYSQAQRTAVRNSRDALIESARTDWRPICSYGNNLDRMSDFLLDTDSAWVTLGRTLAKPREMLQGRMPGRQQRERGERFLADQMVRQYPWIWSAAVLVGLMGVSIWILSARVKSLDRLK